MQQPYIFVHYRKEYGVKVSKLPTEKPPLGLETICDCDKIICFERSPSNQATVHIRLAE